MLPELGFTLVDWLLIGVLLGCAWIGWRRGLVVSALAFAGFVGGAVAAALALPMFTQAITAGPARAVFLGAGILLAALAGQFLMSLLGQRLREGLRWQPARLLDAVGGAVLGIAAVAAIAWLVASALSALPRHPVTDQFRNSQVLVRLDSAIPTGVRDALAGLRQALNATDIPRLASTSGIQRAAGSVVRITGRSCGTHQRGTGFIVAPRLVLTSAHVVTAVDRVRVNTGTASDVATVVHFDPARDLAVLHLTHDVAPPITWFDGPVTPGAEGTVVGYPDGAGQEITPVRLGGSARAWNGDLATPAGTEVIAVRGALRPGSSGSPLLDSDGQVLGMVFGRSQVDHQAAYALPSAELRLVLSGLTGVVYRKVDTGSCQS